MDNFKQRFEIIYEKYKTLYGAGCARVNERTFASFLEIPVQTVRNWRERNTVPSAKGLKALHDKLGFAYDWLISGEGEMFDNTAKALATKDEALAAQARLVEEKDAEIARLRAMLLVDGVGDKDAATNTGKAAGGQG